MERFTHEQDIEGRISNLNWKPSTQWALPILEAVSNALHATEGLQAAHRSIVVTLIREGDDQAVLGTDKQRERPIVGFRVEDNGIGLNEKNFLAFKTVDTRNKREIGGKGIGRLFWLKAFSDVSIISKYCENGKTYERKAKLMMSGVEHVLREIESPISVNSTSVEVKGVKPAYKKFYHRRAATVAKEISEEFLPYFILSGWPETLTVSYTDAGEADVSVKELTRYTNVSDSFEIKGENFSVEHIANYVIDRHRVLYCAGNRVVSAYKPDVVNSIPKKALVDDNGEQFSYMCLVSSEYLTNTVTAERDAFQIPESFEGLALIDCESEVSSREIENRLKPLIFSFLTKPLQRAQDDTVKRIGSVVLQHPELSVLSYTDDDVQCLLSANENEIKKSFRARLHEELDNSRVEMEALVSRLETDSAIDFGTFQLEFSKEVERFSLLNQSHVVSYVLYRKHVISLFEKSLAAFSGEKRVLESFIHGLVFPMGKQGAPIDFGSQHNLWLLDERLSMVEWIASDVPINKHHVLIDGDCGKEPDLVFYNLAYADEDSEAANGYSEIHVVEFKRPIEFKNDPVEQIQNYIFDIKKSKVFKLEQVNGQFSTSNRRVKVAQNAMYYGYVVFDLSQVEHTEKWERTVHTRKLKPFMGGYMFADGDTIIFVNSFENVIEIAKKRNQVFYKKLLSSLQQ